MGFYIKFIDEQDMLDLSTRELYQGGNFLLSSASFTISSDFRLKTCCELIAKAIRNAKDEDTKLKELGKLRWRLLSAKSDLKKAIVSSPTIESSLLALDWKNHAQTRYDVWSCLNTSTSASIIGFATDIFNNSFPFEIDSLQKTLQSISESGREPLEARRFFHECSSLHHPSYKDAALTLSRIYLATGEKASLEPLTKSVKDILEVESPDEISILKGAAACSWIPFLIPDPSDERGLVRECLQRGYLQFGYEDQALRGLQGITQREEVRNNPELSSRFSKRQ